MVVVDTNVLAYLYLPDEHSTCRRFDEAGAAMGCTNALAQ